MLRILKYVCSYISRPHNLHDSATFRILKKKLEEHFLKKFIEKFIHIILLKQILFNGDNLKMTEHSFSDYRGTLVDSNQIAYVSHWTIWLHHILLQQLYIARFHHQHKSSFHPGAHHISSLLLWVGSLWKYLNLIVFILFAVVLTCATVPVTFWEKSDRNRLVVNFTNISFFLFLLSLYLQIHIILTQFLQFIYPLFLFYNLWTWSQPNPLNPSLFTWREEI